MSLAVSASSAASAANAAAATLRVASKQTIADGVVGLTLVDPAGGRLQDWAPGAHIDLILTSADGAQYTRQYSLCGDRRDASSYNVAVLREPAGRGGSAYVHEHLLEGHLVGVGGPRNNFALVPASRYLFVAGGIGITPILPMIAAAERLGADWSLLYGGRSRTSMGFLSELNKYGNRVQVCPQDETGLLDLNGAIGEHDSSTTKIYCCGPAPLLNALEAATTGWPPGTVRTERFVPKEQNAPARTTPFVVTLARTGTSVTVDPNESILDALDRDGVKVLSSCKEGTCGTCETSVLDGTPDHRDSLLSDAERERGDCMFVCVSRSVDDQLVLDL